MNRIQVDTCPVCGNQENKDFLTVKDHSISEEEFQINKCPKCKFIFTYDPPSESEIGPYYESEDYISHSDTKAGMINRVYHTVRDYMLGKKYRMLKALGSGKKLLDVGCGTGYFLHYMEGKDFDALGVEISDQARAYGKKTFSVDIREPKEFLSGSLENDYDFITLWHVLEHLYDLDKYMTTLKNSLAPDGHLVIAVPNPDCFDAASYDDHWAAYDVPRHLWHFTPETMNKLCQKHGLKVIDKKRLPFDVFYNCMLSEKYQGSGLSFLKGGMIGAWYYLKSTFHIDRSSSLVYVIKKSV